MPSKSKKQQRLMGMVRAYQKGLSNDLSNDLSPAVKKIANNVKPYIVKKFASTKHKNLPEKVKKEKNENVITFTEYLNYEKI